jgi:hypothetical protein
MSRGSKSCLVQLAFEFADFSAHFCMIDRVKREESRQLSQTRSIRKKKSKMCPILYVLVCRVRYCAIRTINACRSNNVL